MGTVPGVFDTKSLSELWAAGSKRISVNMINWGFYALTHHTVALWKAVEEC